MDEKEKIIKMDSSNILQDKKQVKVGIPKDIVGYLQINPKEDVIIWSIISNENQEISLRGHLVKGGRIKNENIKDK